MKQTRRPKYIYKISSDRFAKANWDLTIDDDIAHQLKQIISRSDCQGFRLIDEIMGISYKKRTKGGVVDLSEFEERKYISEKKYKNLVLAIVFTSQKDFHYASKNGVTLNGVHFKRFVGTAGGIKNNTVLFVSTVSGVGKYCDTTLYNALSLKADCGRNPKIKIVPSKFEAYKALIFSGSEEVALQTKRIAVLPDAITKVVEDVWYLTDRDDKGNPLHEPKMTFEKNYQNDLNISDGLGLIRKEYMLEITKQLVNRNDITLDNMFGGICIRHAFTKGMLFPFDWDRWIDVFNNGVSTCSDVWGNSVDLKQCDIILTEGMLKLWSSYSSIDDYLLKTEEHGYKLSVCKTSDIDIADRRRLNYQYLQSFNLSNSDISELAKPTVDEIKANMCGDYTSTLQFLGVKKNMDKSRMKEFTFKEGLAVNEELMKDVHTIKAVNKMIKKKITEAKIGKLYVNGNYQVASGDPICVLERAFGKEIKGLLGRREFYSSYWVNLGVPQILLMRSPMTCMNNIILGNINSSDDCREWYKYMKNVIIFNCKDNTMCAENGEDFDGDTNFTTNNPVLLRNHVETNTIICSQSSAKKQTITESRLQKANAMGFNNNVGVVTNIATSMYNTLSRFSKGSKEYAEMEYRIMCTQLYQQNVIDSAKGCEITDMPSHWYLREACEKLDADTATKQFNLSICTDKKPYFMAYIYPALMRGYTANINTINSKCMTSSIIRGESVEEVLNIVDKNPSEQYIMDLYHETCELDFSESATNKLCSKIEEIFHGYLGAYIKSIGEFDYSVLKSSHTPPYIITQKNKVIEIYREYSMTCYTNSKEVYINSTPKEQRLDYKEIFFGYFRNKLMSITTKGLTMYTITNILIDYCYGENNHGAHRFLWEMCGEQIIDNLITSKEEKHA